MKELLIVADLGCVKGYLVRQDLGDPSPTIDLLQEETLNHDYVHFVDRDSDMAGRFEGGGAIGQQTGMSYGERHGEETEAFRTQLHHVGDVIRELCTGQPDCGQIHFAAPQVIYQSLIELVGEPLKAKLGKSLPLDIIHESKLDLLKRFGFAKSD